jgi:hypothetical protein
MLGGPEQRVEPPQLDRALPLPQGPLARVERQPRLRSSSRPGCRPSDGSRGKVRMSTQAIARPGQTVSCYFRTTVLYGARNALALTITERCNPPAPTASSPRPGMATPWSWPTSRGRWCRSWPERRRLRQRLDPLDGRRQLVTLTVADQDRAARGYAAPGRRWRSSRDGSAPAGCARRVRPTPAPVSRRRLRVGLGPAAQRRADPVARAGRRGCGSARSAALQMSFACSLPSPDPWTCGGRWSPSEADWLRVRRRAPLRVAAAASKGVSVSLTAWAAFPITETAIDAPIMVQM